VSELWLQYGVGGAHCVSDVQAVPPSEEPDDEPLLDPEDEPLLEPEDEPLLLPELLPEEVASDASSPAESLDVVLSSVASSPPDDELEEEEEEEEEEETVASSPLLEPPELTPDDEPLVEPPDEPASGEPVRPVVLVDPPQPIPKAMARQSPAQNFDAFIDLPPSRVRSRPVRRRRTRP
jgi:hypothetical protein